jgi:hypothetical protein
MALVPDEFVFQQKRAPGKLREIFNEREPTRAREDVEEGYSCLHAAVQGTTGNPLASRTRNT